MRASRNLVWVTARLSVVVLLACGLAACGRYQPPLSPDMLAPSGVQNLVITPSAQAVTFSWIAADTDRRGKELKSAEGFSVERKELVARGDETDPTVEFKKLKFLPDTHVEVREKLRRDARSAGKIGRTVKSPPEYMTFTYTDTTPAVGKTYLYQIVPINQGGTKGVVEQLAKVVFQGAQSTVVMVASSEAADTTTSMGATGSPSATIR